VGWQPFQVIWVYGVYRGIYTPCIYHTHIPNHTNQAPSNTALQAGELMVGLPSKNPTITPPPHHGGQVRTSRACSTLRPMSHLAPVPRTNMPKDRISDCDQRRSGYMMSRTSESR